METMIARKFASIGIMVMFLTVRSLATVYTVGDAGGWTLGVDYGTWSASKTFVVGDSLVFNYGSGHTVDEVKQADHTKCTIGNAITSDSKGPTWILLKTPGTHYFICGIIGHCGSGMKLSINALATNSSSTSPPSTTATTSGGVSGTYPTTTTNPYMTPHAGSPKRNVFCSFYGLIIVVVVAVILRS